MSDINQTQFFKVNVEPELRVKEVLDTVYNAMREKGYNPVNQIVGYIMSGDPDLHHQPQRRPQHDHESGAGRGGGGASQGLYKNNAQQ